MSLVVVVQAIFNESDLAHGETIESRSTHHALLELIDHQVRPIDIGQIEALLVSKSGGLDHDARCQICNCSRERDHSLILFGENEIGFEVRRHRLQGVHKHPMALDVSWLVVGIAAGHQDPQASIGLAIRGLELGEVHDVGQEAVIAQSGHFVIPQIDIAMELEGGSTIRSAQEMGARPPFW